MIQLACAGFLRFFPLLGFSIKLTCRLLATEKGRQLWCLNFYVLPHCWTDKCLKGISVKRTWPAPPFCWSNISSFPLVEVKISNFIDLKFVLFQEYPWFYQQQHNRFLSIPTQQLQLINLIPTQQLQFINLIPTQQLQLIISIPTQQLQFINSIPTQQLQIINSIPTQQLQFINSIPTQQLQFINSIPTQQLQFINSIPSQNRQFINSIPTQKLQFINSIPTQQLQFINSIPTQNLQFINSIPTQNLQFINSDNSNKNVIYPHFQFAPFDRVTTLN